MFENRIEDIENRLTYMESEFTDKYDFAALENRIDKIENEVTYRDIYIYISVFYIIYLASKQLNNIV
jgi:tetrahydromethanopterin S-methyltransferase subunit G